MAGLCEGGNEPPGSLEASIEWLVGGSIGRSVGRFRFRYMRCDKSHSKHQASRRLRTDDSLPIESKRGRVHPNVSESSRSFPWQALLAFTLSYRVMDKDLSGQTSGLSRSQVNKETGCSSINGTSTNDGPVKRKLQGRRITTVPVSDYESDEIELDTDYDVSGVLSIFTDILPIQRYMAAVLGIPRSTVLRVYYRFRETGDYSRRPGSGRKRVTSARDDHFIVLNTLRNRHSTAIETRRNFQKIRQVNVSERTVRGRLDECGLIPEDQLKAQHCSSNIMLNDYVLLTIMLIGTWGSVLHR
ncbi:hypothetical protein ANN_19905 [Periplaneta americana]|uniref:Transposase Tc1-like domain-containing protein n=1 Tax=Periplaneta americana TaxID=6978 RepID=A0ABQ8SB66_PERAM|nr:hypothetical protein ANN_19905 [Periplaneta americana]